MGRKNECWLWWKQSVTKGGLGNRRYSIQETLDNCLYKEKSETNPPSTNDWKQKMLGSGHQSWPSDFACCCLTGWLAGWQNDNSFVVLPFCLGILRLLANYAPAFEVSWCTHVASPTSRTCLLLLGLPVFWMNSANSQSTTWEQILSLCRRTQKYSLWHLQTCQQQHPACSGDAPLLSQLPASS